MVYVRDLFEHVGCDFCDALLRGELRRDLFSYDARGLRVLVVR